MNRKGVVSLFRSRMKKMQNQILLSEILDSNKISTYDFIPTLPNPTPFHPFILEDGNLGIPASLLQDLYTTALLTPFTLKSTKILLMINPEHYSAWNIRRTLSNDLQHELLFTTLVIRKHPKRGATWSYRAWLLSKMKLNEIDYEKEVELGLEAARLYYQNYHAWTHLRRVFSMFPEKV
jgi:hypothetical protein